MKTYSWISSWKTGRYLDVQFSQPCRKSKGHHESENSLNNCLKRRKVLEEKFTLWFSKNWFNYGLKRICFQSDSLCKTILSRVTTTFSWMISREILLLGILKGKSYHLEYRVFHLRLSFGIKSKPEFLWYSWNDSDTETECLHFQQEIILPP